MNIRKQLIVIALLLLLHSCPRQISTGDLSGEWLFTVIAVQHVFVILCNRLVKESWIIPIIAAEIICMGFNVLIAISDIISDTVHAQIILCAFIIQLLSIYNGIAGDSVGKYHSRFRLRGRILHLRNLRHSRLNSCPGIENK